MYNLGVKKNFVAIFAHPDDESFGPSGTIAKLAEKYNVYLICATSGQAGESSLKEVKDLSKVRESELRESAKILGVKKVFFLGFQDGELSNNLYHKLAEKIKKTLEDLKPEKIMTDEIRGISGHIDHITVALATTFVFYKLPFIKELMYYCIEKREVTRDYFIYMPPGFDKKDIDLRVDIADVWDKKVAAIKAHKSQAHDGKYILSLYEKGIISKTENFLLLKKQK